MDDLDIIKKNQEKFKYDLIRIEQKIDYLLDSLTKWNKG